MAIKCPFCLQISHCRSSQYLSDSVKRIYYQCKNLDCSCTFTALENVEKIISKPERLIEEQTVEETKMQMRKGQSLGRYGSSFTLPDRHAQT